MCPECKVIKEQKNGSIVETAFKACQECMQKIYDYNEDFE